MSSENWLPISELHQPFNDAYNYRSRQQKQLFSKLFLRTHAITECLLPSTYFLMGEKGAGKTAYAVYLENNTVDGNRCKVTTMTETQYKRFINLKIDGKLAYSDYANIWRSMLLFMTGQLIITKSKNVLTRVTRKFSRVEKEIEKWSKNALNPEMESAFAAITSESIKASGGTQGVGSLEAQKSNQSSENTSIIKHNLLDTENGLKEAINEIKLRDNHVLFIDGIDYRPEGVSYDEYIECIKGLAEATWQLNTEFFNSIRDSKGRIKIVLLVRPDVFHSLNLYNSNSRLQDNTVYLDWVTPEQEYKTSPIFEVSDRFFAKQQKVEPELGASWTHYYKDGNPEGHQFKKILRNTFQKPRDILTFIKITQDHQIRLGRGKNNLFPANIMDDPAIKRQFSDYLLGETRNYSAFYMMESDFQKYLKFFQYLNGKATFSFDYFDQAFTNFTKWAKDQEIKEKSYLSNPESLLQFFYDVNIIGYSEKTEDTSQGYYHWSFRERSSNNIAPKVKPTDKLMINPGIAKALDIGKSFQKSRSSSKVKSHR